MDAADIRYLVKRSFIFPTSDNTWKIYQVKPIINIELEEKFKQKRFEIQQQLECSHDPPLTHLFICCEDQKQVVENGICINPKSRSVLCRSEMGIHLYRHADLCLSTLRTSKNLLHKIIVCEAVLGNSCEIDVTHVTSPITPCPEYHSYVSSKPATIWNQIELACKKSTVYLYEIGVDSSGPARPRHLRPIAEVLLRHVPISQTEPRARLTQATAGTNIPHPSTGSDQRVKPAESDVLKSGMMRDPRLRDPRPADHGHASPPAAHIHRLHDVTEKSIPAVLKARIKKYRPLQQPQPAGQLRNTGIPTIRDRLAALVMLQKSIEKDLCSNLPTPLRSGYGDCTGPLTDFQPLIYQNQFQARPPNIAPSEFTTSDSVHGPSFVYVPHPTNNEKHGASSDRAGSTVAPPMSLQFTTPLPGDPRARRCPEPGSTVSQGANLTAARSVPTCDSPVQDPLRRQIVHPGQSGVSQQYAIPPPLNQRLLDMSSSVPIYDAPLSYPNNDITNPLGLGLNDALSQCPPPALRPDAPSAATGLWSPSWEVPNSPPLPLQITPPNHSNMTQQFHGSGTTTSSGGLGNQTLLPISGTTSSGDRCQRKPVIRREVMYTQFPPMAKKYFAAAPDAGFTDEDENAGGVTPPWPSDTEVIDMDLSDISPISDQYNSALARAEAHQPNKPEDKEGGFPVENPGTAGDLDEMEKEDGEVTTSADNSPLRSHDVDNVHTTQDPRGQRKSMGHRKNVKQHHSYYSPDRARYYCDTPSKRNIARANSTSSSDSHYRYTSDSSSDRHFSPPFRRRTGYRKESPPRQRDSAWRLDRDTSPDYQYRTTQGRSNQRFGYKNRSPAFRNRSRSRSRSRDRGANQRDRSSEKHWESRDKTHTRFHKSRSRSPEAHSRDRRGNASDNYRLSPEREIRREMSGNRSRSRSVRSRSRSPGGVVRLTSGGQTGCAGKGKNRGRSRRRKEKREESPDLPMNSLGALIQGRVNLVKKRQHFTVKKRVLPCKYVHPCTHRSQCVSRILRNRQQPSNQRWRTGCDCENRE